MVEFLISSVDHPSLVVGGVVNSGTIRPGYVFTQARLETASKRGDVAGIQSVNLSVERIVAYRQQVDELPSGMTGELFMRGTGTEVLRTGVMLL